LAAIARVLAEDGAEALAGLGLADLGLATSRRSRDARPRPTPYTGVFAG
jgi:hypothetical protein